MKYMKKPSLFLLRITLFLLLPALLLLASGCIHRPPDGMDRPVSCDEITSSFPDNARQILPKHGFTVGYEPSLRQALWVGYPLSSSQLAGPKVKRSGRFIADPEVSGTPARPEDYSFSGFDRGHLAPAADMSFSLRSMNDSFLMSNISPQRPGFNRGIWADLERQVRQWALAEDRLFIFTGPVFSGGGGKMKPSGIPVPDAFFKVILDMTPPLKMIAFIIPNRSSSEDLSAFVVSVDDVENLTGCDFFRALDDELEEHLEKTSSADDWIWSGRRRRAKPPR